MDTAFLVVHDLVIASAVAVSLFGTLWVQSDASKRVADPRRVRRFVLAAAAAPVVGVAVYLFARPCETLAERRARELRRRLLEAELHGERCLVCRTSLEPDFLCCPTCAVELRRRCSGCEALLELAWQQCPHCASDAAGPAAPEPVPAPRLRAA